MQYPKLLSDLFEKEIHQLPLCEVRKQCNELKFEVTASQMEALEQSTPGQFMSKLWQKHRAGRITVPKIQSSMSYKFYKACTSPDQKHMLS
ncbi:hypothetical protein ACJMK2_044654 [Sinanodonta woodiana]|uniref:Uncharacterized protein n=1 Tax=Sinanodonta woodiana TaxID=1069815 RepID=A0ABD3W0Q9_SINWO